MANNIPRIAIVTPLKNELANLDLLIKSISEQTIPIGYWIIVQNGSTDGSKEYLANIDFISNVANIRIIEYELPNEKYELGLKYANVVNQGFLYLEENGIIDKLDYIGILDADCFPNKDYYERLISFMTQNPKIGISSGLGYNLDGKYDGISKTWVRGNCRLWTRQCFKDAGYILGPSADTLSVCKAELKGWLAIPDQSLGYKCREVGQKVDYKYYGYSSYFRGITPIYAILKTINYFLAGNAKNAKSYYNGYFESKQLKKNRINDLQILTHFSNYLLYKLKRKLKV